MREASLPTSFSGLPIPSIARPPGTKEDALTRFARLDAWLACCFVVTAACTATLGGGSASSPTDTGKGAVGPGASSAAGAPPAGAGAAGGNGQAPAGTSGGISIPPPGSSAGTGSNTSPGSAAANCPAGASASPLHARLLSPSQYNNTIQDLLKIGGNPAETNHIAGGETAALDKTALGFRADAAAAIATQAAASLASWSPCVPASAAGQAACEQQIISQVGQRAYRHPLSADDTAQLKTLFDAGLAAGKDFPTGVNWFLTGLLQTPDFQYQLLRPSPTEKAGQVVPISGYEMASRLSYSIWDSMPDDALLAAAASGLADVASVQAQVTRMIQSKTVLLRGMSAFYSNWLNIPAYGEGIVKEDPTGMQDAGFTQDVALALGQSVLMGATQLYASGSASIAALFSGESYYMNDTLRKYYNLGVSAGSATGFTATAMTGQHRSGLLTHPGFLAVNARPQVTAPILRGTFVTANLLCLGLQVPTNLVIPDLPETPQPGLTTRELIVQNHVQPQCASCHDTIDPPGFALEGFDTVGNVRTMDNGKPVDTSGTMANAGDLNGPFASGDEFLSRVARSDTVKACFAQQFLEHAISGEVSTAVAASDQCSVASVGAAFAKTGDLFGLVSLAASSDAFRFRMSEGVAP